MQPASPAVLAPDMPVAGLTQQLASGAGGPSLAVEPPAPAPAPAPAVSTSPIPGAPAAFAPGGVASSHIQHAAPTPSLGAGPSPDLIPGALSSPATSRSPWASVRMPATPTPAHASHHGQSAPPSAPSGIGVAAAGGSGSGSVSSSWLWVVLAAFAAWAAQALRRHRPSVALWRPMAFVSLLERPG
jgi:hypothetical protein